MQSVSPVRKRPKLELETPEKPDVLDANGYRRRLIEHKMRRMPALREKYVDALSELFFLQSGGNMMDYHSWQKRPPMPPYLHFLRQHRLDPDDDNEDLTKPLSSISEFSQLSTVTTAATTTTTTTITSIAVAGLSTTTLATTTVTSAINSSVQSQNAEVKISGVGVTPVAISTTLPAAVAQLNQQGKFLSISRMVKAVLIVMKKEGLSLNEIETKSGYYTPNK